MRFCSKPSSFLPFPGHKGSASGNDGKKELGFEQNLMSGPPTDAYSKELVERPTVLLEHGVKYTGQWKGDKRDGHGVQEWPDGARFDGQWRSGLAEGFGKFVHADGDVYEGQWRDDKANGDGHGVQ